MIEPDNPKVFYPTKEYVAAQDAGNTLWGTLQGAYALAARRARLTGQRHRVRLWSQSYESQRGNPEHLAYYAIEAVEHE